MKIIFVQRQIFALPGIASLAGAVRRAGHAAEVLIENAERHFESVLVAAAPDVIGITICSSDARWLQETLPRIRRSTPEAFVLVGGIHSTIHPALIDEYPGIDAICVGEGEEPVVELLDALEATRSGGRSAVSSQQPGEGGKPSELPIANRLLLTSIKNLHVRRDGKIHRNPPRPLITNLDDYPEDREIYFRRYPDLARDSLLQYIFSRGCPYPCTFCVNSTLNRIFKGLGPVQRRKSVDFSIRELKELRHYYRSAQTCFFIDDLFLHDREWVKEFLPRYRSEIGLPFICSAGPKTIDDEMVDLLRDSGCASVEFGIETGNEEKRRKIFKKGAFTDREFRRQIGLVKSRGIEVYAPSMFVFPTETPADSFRTVEFYHELNVDHPFSSFLIPYPDTEIFEIAVREGAVPADLKAEDLPGNYFTESICRIPRRRTVENIQYLFYFFVRFPRFYRNFRWLVYLPVPLKLIRYAGLFFWFARWKRLKYGETIRYFWRFRKAR